jgi:DNA-binding NarL/FixJ family response regulator
MRAGLEQAMSRSALIELSSRETEILAFVAEGLSNRAIARRLRLSQRTVEAHTRAILMKLNIPADDQVNPRVLAARAFWESGSRHYAPLAAAA